MREFRPWRFSEEVDMVKWPVERLLLSNLQNAAEEREREKYHSGF